jgi:hypothetical protein
MSPLDTSPRWRNVARTGAPLALAIALVASASAQATWSDAAPRKGYRCSAVIPAPHTPPVSFQSCVIVHATANGAYVQGAVKATNMNDNPRRLVRPDGYTRGWLDNKFHRSDYCGSTTLAGGQARWCYGKTTFIAGHGRDVYATGYVWAGAATRDRLNSPHTKTAPPAAPALPAAWSNGPVDAAPWRPTLRRHSSISCGDRSIPANLPPQSVARGWTARTQALIKNIRGPAFGWTNMSGAANGSRSGHVRDSFHYCGRAVDAFAPGARAGSPVVGTPLSASWRVANWAAHNAAALNISQVIFYDRKWTARGGGWRPYTNPGTSADRDTLQHRDHVHISVY